MSTSDVTSGLDGRRLLVVGATLGGGRAVAAAAAAAGALVVAAGRRADRLDRLVAERHGDLVGLRADVRVADDCRRIVDEAVDVLGGLDEAPRTRSGVSPLGRLVDMDVDDWQAVLETNVVGAAVGAAATPSGTSRPATDARCSCRRCRSRILARSWSRTAPARPRSTLADPRLAQRTPAPVLHPGRGRPDGHRVRPLLGPGDGRRAHRGPRRAGLRQGDGHDRRRGGGAVLDALASPVWVEDLRLMPRNHPDPAAT